MPNADTTAATPATTKKDLTPEEKTAKKRAYARAYYASHKEQMKAAVKKCMAKKAAFKKTEKKGKAFHAVCPDGKKAGRKTPEQKRLAELEKTLMKAAIKRDELKAKLAGQNDEIKKIKDEIKGVKALIKAVKAADCSVYKEKIAANIAAA